VKNTKKYHDCGTEEGRQDGMLKKGKLQYMTNKTTKENMIHSVRRKIGMYGTWVKTS
jgi:hypothetical protein